MLRVLQAILEDRETQIGAEARAVCCSPHKMAW